MAKKLKYLVIHCSATPKGRDVKAAEIVRWHLDAPPKGRGWRVPGYSHIFELDGNMVTIKKYNDDGWVQAGEITNGVLGFNDVSRHICYVGGGGGVDTRTPQQNEAMTKYVRAFLRKHPDCEVVGHRDLTSTKACPSFDVRNWVRNITKIKTPDPKTKGRM